MYLTTVWYKVVRTAKPHEYDNHQHQHECSVHFYKPGDNEHLSEGFCIVEPLMSPIYLDLMILIAKRELISRCLSFF